MNLKQIIGEELFNKYKEAREQATSLKKEELFLVVFTKRLLNFEYVVQQFFVI